MNVREQFETNKKFLEYERDEQAFLLFVFVFVVREPYLGTSHVSRGSGNMAQKSQAKTVLAGAATFVPAPVGNYR